MVHYSICKHVYIYVCSTALHFNTTFCCDRHKDDVFDLNDFLPSPLYTGTSMSTLTKRKAPAPHVKRRVVKDWQALDLHLIKWLTSASENDPLHGVQSVVDILSDHNRAMLICANPALLFSPCTITKLLDETQEWAEEWSALLLDVIRQYDNELAASGVNNKALQTQPSQKKSKIDC
ncbi:hypothetical protein L208DRAFT_1464151 [Tricholoma matsutake]|nr:hypothetical protein L208DRAFT_1464151 [Tricholoma matsutake 945]